MNTFAISAVFVVCCCTYSFGYPLAASLSLSSDQEADAYLSKYNYMGEHNPQMANLRDPSTRTQAIRDFQAMANIDVTGTLTNETMQMMKVPRCGVPDSHEYSAGTINSRRKRYVTEGGRWSRKDLTYRFRSYTTDMSQQQVDSEIDRAFRVWSDNSGLTFTKTTGSSDIDVLFATGNHGDGNSFDGSGGVLAHAYFPQFGGDAHFDDSERYTMGSNSGINLFQVAAHEFGHSLGLGHSNDRSALMAPFYSGYQPNFELPSDDVQGIQRLYGPPAGATAPTNPQPTRPTNPQPTNGPAPPPGDFCQDGQFDTITSTDQGSVYGFRKEKYYLIGSGTPQEIGTIASDWPGLPGGDLDASLYWPRHRGWYRCVRNNQEQWCYGSLPGATYFFKGSQVWKFVNKENQWGRSEAISEIFQGLPNDIDSAFLWGRNGQTYFIKGNQYYRATTYRERTAVHSGYPRELSVWWTYSDATHQRAIDHVDAALQYSNGKTYFFVDGNYYRFNDNSFKIDDTYPRPINEWWYGCRQSGNIQGHSGDLVEDIVPEEMGGEGEGEGINAAPTDTIPAVTLITTLLLTALLF